MPAEVRSQWKALLPPQSGKLLKDEAPAMTRRLAAASPKVSDTRTENCKLAEEAFPLYQRGDRADQMINQL